MANPIVTDIQLWKADRSAQITLPGSETFSKIMSSEFKVSKSLGKPWSASFSIRAGSQVATATASDAYYLTKKKIIRLVYDDSSIQEWRIRRIGRQFSGEQDYQIELEPIWMDLAYIGLRQTLSTGDVRTSVNFYSQTVGDVLTAILSDSYNCPALFGKGSVASALNNETVRVGLNGASIMDALKAVANAVNAEWEVTYKSGPDNYEVDFYAAGGLGGGSGQAADRPVHMGAGRGNRQNMLMRDTEQDYFSRVVPIAGQGTETRGIGDVELNITLISSTLAQIDNEQDIILANDFPITSDETLYLETASGGWAEVTATNAANQRITTATSLGGTGASYTGRFALGASKKKLTYLEDADAVSDIGVVEQTYRRTDIPIYENLFKSAGKTDDFSNWSGGLPVGVLKINGAETVTEETGDQFVKFGNKSAKVSCGVDQGIRTVIPIPDTGYPIWSLLAYIYVESGGIKLEFEDSDGNLIPRGEFAETNQANLQGLALAGGEPATGSANVRIVATEASTVFYVDAWTLCNSAAAVPFAPQMGIYDLWIEAGNELIRNGGIQGNEYTGTVWDDSYFPNDGTLREIDLGTWVQFRDGYNGSTFGFSENLRVIECTYVEEFGRGRLKKTVRLSNRPRDLNQFLTSNFVTQSSQQEGNDLPIVNAISAIEKAIRDGNLEITAAGDIILKGAGKITNDANDFTINDDGITIDAGSSYSIGKSIDFKQTGGSVVGSIFHQEFTTGSPSVTVNEQINESEGYNILKAQQQIKLLSTLDGNPGTAGVVMGLLSGEMTFYNRGTPGATEAAWITVNFGGNTYYIRLYSSK